MRNYEREVIQARLESEKAVLQALEKEYLAALEQINEKIKLLQSDELTQSRIYQIRYQQALKGQIEAILEKLHGDEYSTIQQYLSDSYSDGFLGAMYSIHKQGIPVIIPIDKSAAVKAVLTDSRLSAPLYEALGVDVKAMKKRIRAEISRGIASGMAYPDIARNLQNATGAPLERAKTIVRTEGHRIQQASAEDARQAAKARGADVVKQWDSTLDGATRPTHRRLDGQIRELDKPFTCDGKKAMYPGAFGNPAEDCNCRCVALTRARWALDDAEYQTQLERARFFGLNKGGSFAAFRRKYLKAAETVDNSGKSGIINLDIQFFANGKQRAEKYSTNWANASLDKVLSKLVPGAKVSPVSETGKITYSSGASNYSVIYDVDGDYFRIEDKRLIGKRKYVDLEGNDVSNVTENGKTRGRTKDEYQQITHFKNSREKED